MVKKIGGKVTTGERDLVEHLVLWERQEENCQLGGKMKERGTPKRRKGEGSFLSQVM